MYVEYLKALHDLFSNFNYFPLKQQFQVQKKNNVHNVHIAIYSHTKFHQPVLNSL